MICIHKRGILIMIISFYFCLFAQSLKNMAESDYEFELLEIMTTVSAENLEIEYGNLAKSIETGVLKDDWLISPVTNNESVLTRTEKGFILERKQSFAEKWQGAVDSPRFIVHPKKKYKVSFKAKASEPVTVVLALNKKGPPWDNAGLWQSLNLQKEFKNYSFTFTVTTDSYCGFSLTELGQLSGITIELEDYIFEEINKA